jgi:membrane protease YdiL (CAAX protease family)
VVISGVGFGLLHNSGGRNLAFAAWASLVGILYGGAFLYTQDIFVPMVSHSLANAAAGILWRQSQKG